MTHITARYSISGGRLDVPAANVYSAYAIAARYLGCGLAAYIRQQKLRYANQLLIETNMSVSAIAEATGFADYNHFSKTYKREFGITARQYRNNALKG